MLFNSVSFLFFFPVTAILYFNTPLKFRNLLLVAASCFFYMWARPAYILVFIYIVTVDYFAGIQIEKSDGLAKKRWLYLSLFANLSLLFFFKGFDSFCSVIRFFNLDNNNSIFFGRVFLPIGLSFHTFQAMSYTIEVYRGTQRAERNFINYALYVMFFPQLVAGPIERPQHMFPQLREPKSFDYGNVVNGLRLMLWGFFKKIVVADSAGVIVNQVYNDVHSYSGFVLGIATFLFAFQIFCDFSGYSDIAIGAARIFGFNLVTNFNNPYVSSSCSEFWRRWHISLSTWFRDYVYIPLGGNRVSKNRHEINLMLTFWASGLWHGFKPTFFVWGALNGFYIIFGLWTLDIRKKLAYWIGLDKIPRFHHILKMTVVFLLMCFGWIFFRANNLADAWYVTTHLWGTAQKWKDSGWVSVSISDLGWNPNLTLFCFLTILFTQWVNKFQEKKTAGEVFAKMNVTTRWFIYYLLTLTILLVWLFSSPGPKQFLYYQF